MTIAHFSHTAYLRILKTMTNKKTFSMKKVIIMSLAALALVACQQTKKNQTTESNEKTAFQVENCDITLGGIHFTKMINGADKQVSEKDGIIRITASEGTDFFIDPVGKLTKTNAQVLFTEIDNTKPFTFSARIKPGFTEDGVYNQGNLMVLGNDTLWQKICFEQDERGKHRVVTVRTVGTSDDNNHDVIAQDFIYYKISSDTHIIGSYYSLDGKEWQLVRLYKNNYPKNLLVGFSSLAPRKGECVCEFSELSKFTNNVSDFRLGE